MTALDDLIEAVENYPAAEHGNLPLDPHECARQVKAEILATLKALRSTQQPEE